MTPTETHGEATGKRRVLIVDDNADAAATLLLLLRRHGFDPVVSHDGPSALLEAGHQRPDAAVLDIGLPGMDGYELAQRLRADGHAPLLIAVTGYDDAKARARSREAGFAHHFIKPVELRRLLDALRQTT